MHIKVAAALLVALLAPSAFAVLVTNRPVADTTLWQANPNANEGAVPTMIVGGTPSGRARALVRFSLTNLPPGAVVTDASLVLSVTRENTAGPTLDTRLHRLLRPWGEGDNTDQRGGQAAGTGEASWNARFHGAEPWAAPGAAAGTDYVETASASRVLDNTGSYTLTSAGLTADVAAWAAGTATNAGWILIGAEEATPRSARRVATRESGANAPRLIVAYTVPTKPAAPLLRDVAVADGELRFAFAAEGDVIYSVSASADPRFPVAATTEITNVVSRFVPATAVVRDPLGPGPRFYRVAVAGLAD